MLLYFSYYLNLGRWSVLYVSLPPQSMRGTFRLYLFFKPLLDSLFFGIKYLILRKKLANFSLSQQHILKQFDNTELFKSYGEGEGGGDVTSCITTYLNKLDVP